MLSEAPKPSVKNETKLGLRRLSLIFIAASLLAISFAVVPKILRSPVSPGDESQSVNLKDGQKLIGRVGEGYFNFEVTKTEESRQLGLSGRDPLPVTDAMLFVFDNPGKHCFWMKDMKFAIDILWFNESKQLIDIENNVSPNTYPESFCPKSRAQYVVEMKAGAARANEISIGSMLEL